MKKEFYRVCNCNTQQGLWYNFAGEFTGLIHNEFDFCTNNELKMDFDEELVGYLSATDSLEKLWNWFTKKDLEALEVLGWYIHIYETEDYKFYERFQHPVISQENSTLVKVLQLKDLNL